jgi:soluble lytic murein transglycosylase-like protein
LLFAGYVASVNGLVRWLSGDGPWLLDPRHLAGKTEALLAYARHRPRCLLLEDDGDVQRLARDAAIHAGLEPELFQALVAVESSGRAHRISPTGAMGPAQLTAQTAKQLDVDDPYEPRAATFAGARYLRAQLDRFGGDRALALAAYNAGPNAVHGEVPHNGETELYVPRVLAGYRRALAARAKAHAARRIAGR